MAPQIDAWWRNEIPRLADADLAGAIAIFDGATRRFSETMTTHGIALFAAITPLINALTALITRSGVGDVGVLSGTGGAEMAMIDDIWKASRGALTLDQVVANQVSTDRWRARSPAECGARILPRWRR